MNDFLIVLSLLLMIACAIVGAVAWRQHSYGLLAVNTFMFCINAMLAWINWSFR